MKLTERMKKILLLLAQRRLSTSLEEEKQLLKRSIELETPYLVKLGIMPKLEITDEDVQKEYYGFISLSTKTIILSLEVDLRNNFQKMFTDDECFYVNESLAVSGYYPDFRRTVSLPEIISTKLYPKGRNAWYRTRCEDYPEYNEAKNKAEVLYASYTRTLKKLLKHGLISVNPFEAKRYYITENGLTILNKFGLLNTFELSNSDPSHVEAKPYVKFDKTEEVEGLEFN